MSRTRLDAMILMVAWLGLAAPAFASPPDPANCEVPSLITLVARGADGTADLLGMFKVVVRDFNNIPDADHPVLLDFSECPDIRLCADQLEPDVIVDCVARTIEAPTVPNGDRTFRVIGSAANLGASPGSVGACLNVYAGGVFLKTVRVAALDQNGIAGVNGDDFSLFLTDYFSGLPLARSDYDGNGAVDGNDLSLWLEAFFAGGSVQSGGAPCP